MREGAGCQGAVRKAELLSDRHKPSWPFGGPWCHCQQERPGGLVTVATDSWEPGPSRSSYLNPLTSAQHRHFIISSISISLFPCFQDRTVFSFYSSLHCFKALFFREVQTCPQTDLWSKGYHGIVIYCVAKIVLYFKKERS